MVEKFEDLMVWQESMDLAEKICNEFNQSQLYSLKNQLYRSTISIPSNIAEGFDRQTNKEFIRFLFIARGSCAELRTQLLPAMRLNQINKDPGYVLIDKTRKISSMLYNLIKTRENYFT